MAWVQVKYLTPDKAEVTISINTDHIRAIKRRADGKAMILWSAPNVGATTLAQSYEAAIAAVHTAEMP